MEKCRKLFENEKYDKDLDIYHLFSPLHLKITIKTVWITKSVFFFVFFWGGAGLSQSAATAYAGEVLGVLIKAGSADTWKLRVCREGT